MDFKREIERLAQSAQSLTEAIKFLDIRYENAREFTGEFLDECAKSGLRKVSIQRAHKSIPESEGWARTWHGCNGSVFGIGINDSNDEQGWPAIWGVCCRMKINAGTGNHNQHQADCSNLIDGTYHLRKGLWKKIDD